MTRTLPTALSISIVALLCLSCSKDFTSNPKSNAAPETYLALFPDSSLSTGTSRQHIHWWGDDLDGFVVGFLLSFDSTHWTFTTRNDSLFALSLFGRDTTYRFLVRAVDGQGNGRYDHAGPFGAEPFTDLNGNKTRDANESYIDLGLADPTPASLRYPIQNTPPSVEFVKGTEVPDTTFTVATFNWLGTDLDGDETISKYLFALNDTSALNWKEIPRATTLLTVYEKDGLREGSNIFYLKAVDIAGATSKMIRMPDTSRVWSVRKPRTQLLIVDDYSVSDDAGQFYNSITDTLLGGRFRSADVFDIKLGSTPTKRGTLVPPFINPTFIETLKLFKYIFWYSDNNPSLSIAQLSLKQYLESGGKLLFSASFPESALDPRGGIVDFAPVDSLSPSAISFVPANTRMIPEQDAAGYPELKRDTRGVPVAFVRELFRKINATNLYRFESSAFWAGSPVVAVRSGDRNSILFAVPLSRFNEGGAVGSLFYKIFHDEFKVR